MTYKGKKVEIEYTAFPEAVHGTVRGFLSGSVKLDYWLICIDSELAPITQRRTLGHELAHLYLDHLDCDKSIPEIEAEANRNAWKYYRLYKAGALENIT